MHHPKHWRRSLFFCLGAGIGLQLASACSTAQQRQCNPLVDASCPNNVEAPGVTGGQGSTGPGKVGPDIPGTPGASAGGGTGTDDVCEVQKVAAKIQAANVMLVLDKSGSMSQNKWLDGNIERTRWESLYKTVEFMVGHFNQSVRFGMKLFPAKDSTGTDAACKVDAGVDVEISDQNGAAIMAAMPDAGARVAGGTPATTGYAHAVEYLKKLAESGEKRRRIIILVMDGRVADCEDKHEDLVQHAKNAQANGITTFVVGIDVDDSTVKGLQLHRDLNDLARAGGGSKTYFDSSNAARLRDAMEEIVGKISDCRVPLAQSPMQPDWATVSVSGATYRWLGGQVPSCESANLAPETGGFVYTKIDQQDALELCGKACSDYVNSGNVKVNLLCEPPR